MKRLFYPAERPLSGQCPECGGVLTHIFVTELIDTALPWREGNVREAPRWICRRCWGVDTATEPTGGGNGTRVQIPQIVKESRR